MSQEPVKMVDRLLNDCWMSADLDLVPEILDPEVVWTAIESAPDAGTRRGHAEARAYMDDWIEGFDLHPMVIEPAGTGGDGRLVCSLHGAATEKRTGLTSEIHFAGVFDFASDGRLVEIHEYATLEEALRAVGLSE